MAMFSSSPLRQCLDSARSRNHFRTTFFLPLRACMHKIKVDGEPHPISLRMDIFDFIVHPIAQLGARL